MRAGANFILINAHCVSTHTSLVEVSYLIVSNMASSCKPRTCALTLETRDGADTQYMQYLSKSRISSPKTR